MLVTVYWQGITSNHLSSPKLEGTFFGSWEPKGTNLAPIVRATWTNLATRWVGLSIGGDIDFIVWCIWLGDHGKTRDVGRSMTFG